MKGAHFLIFLLLTGCASTEMRKFVGKPIEETFISYGKPENVFEFPDGRRAYQFRWGGGSFVQPGRSSTTVSSVGDVAVARTTSTAAMLLNSPGCLITFIAKDDGSGFRVSEYRVPKQLVC